jgi:hypothetical protein
MYNAQKMSCWLAWLSNTKPNNPKGITSVSTHLGRGHLNWFKNDRALEKHDPTVRHIFNRDVHSNANAALIWTRLHEADSCYTITGPIIVVAINIPDPLHNFLLRFVNPGEIQGELSPVWSYIVLLKYDRFSSLASRTFFRTLLVVLPVFPFHHLEGTGVLRWVYQLGREDKFCPWEWVHGFLSKNLNCFFFRSELKLLIELAA